MAQCCYKTDRKIPQNFPKIDAVSSFQLLSGNTKGISNQYHVTRVDRLPSNLFGSINIVTFTVYTMS